MQNFERHYPGQKNNTVRELNMNRVICIRKKGLWRAKLHSPSSIICAGLYINYHCNLKGRFGMIYLSAADKLYLFRNVSAKEGEKIWKRNKNMFPDSTDSFTN